MLSGAPTDDEHSLENEFPEPVPYKRVKAENSSSAVK
jgi:hypothetical protein